MIDRIEACGRNVFSCGIEGEIQMDVCPTPIFGVRCGLLRGCPRSTLSPISQDRFMPSFATVCSCIFDLLLEKALFFTDLLCGFSF